MIELIIVRHGETDSNIKGTYLGWTDILLNDSGLRQAAAVRDKLKGQRVDKVFSSPLKRASRTAEIINEVLGREIIYNDGLKERNFGSWDDLSHREIIERFPLEYEQWTLDWINYGIKDGESSIQAYKRVIRFIDELVKGHSAGTFLLVTHLGCIRKIIAYLLGMTIEDSWRFRVQNGGITRIEINNEKYAYLTMLNG